MYICVALFEQELENNIISLQKEAKKNHFEP